MSHGLVRNDIVVDLYYTRVFLVKIRNLISKSPRHCIRFYLRRALKHLVAANAKSDRLLTTYALLLIFFATAFRAGRINNEHVTKTFTLAAIKAFKHKCVSAIETTDLLEHKIKNRN